MSGDDDFQPLKFSVIAIDKVQLQPYMLFGDNYDVNLALAVTCTPKHSSTYCPVLAPCDAMEHIRLRSIQIISQWN
jgi:hypothetical protein